MKVSLLGLVAIMFVVGCSSTSPTIEVPTTPNIEATVEARLAEERASSSAYVKQLSPSANAPTKERDTSSSGWMPDWAKQAYPTVILSNPSPQLNASRLPLPSLPTIVHISTPISKAAATHPPMPIPTSVPTRTPQPALIPTRIPPTPIPAPVATSTPHPTLIPIRIPPTPTPVPILDAFNYSVWPSVTISSVVHSFRWQINSDYGENVTVISGHIQTDDGQIVSEISNSRVLKPGGSLRWDTSFTLRFFTTSEVQRFQPVWTIETQNDGTIVCKFNTSAKPCEVIIAPTPSSGSSELPPSSANNMPTPTPFLQAFSSNLKPEQIIYNPVTIADVVLSFTWVLENDSDESVNIVSGSIETSEGELVAQTSLDEILQVVPPGGRYTKSIHPTYQYTEYELNQFDIEWVLMSGSEGVIVCKSSNIGGTVCAVE